MFENLNTLNWASLGNWNADYERFPTLIHQLLDENHEERRYAMDYLFKQGQHAGMHDTVTPYVIPFALEVLNTPSYPDSRLLLIKLRYTTQYVFKATTIFEMRLALAIYDEIEKGFPIYRRLLDNPDPDVRSAAVNLLGYMRDKAVDVIKAFKLRYYIELDEKVRCGILTSMSSLIKESRLIDYYLENCEFIGAIIINNATHLERLAATKALHGIGCRLTPEQVNTIAETLFEAMRSTDDKYFKQNIAENLAQFNSDKLIYLLENHDLSSFDAHLLVRALLASYYLGFQIKRDHWSMEADPYREGLFYTPIKYDDNYLDISKRKKILPSIVNCEAFWQTPTNLLSSFYNLPDNRDELHNYINN